MEGRVRQRSVLELPGWGPWMASDHGVGSRGFRNLTAG